MEALALAAALLTADATVRDTEAFALAGELGRFPAEWQIAADQKLAEEHLEWLQARKLMDADINPRIGDLIDDQQFVVQAYHWLHSARCYVGAAFQQSRSDGFEDDGSFSEPWDYVDWTADALDRIRQLIGPDDYFAGRLPAPMTCQRRGGSP